MTTQLVIHGTDDRSLRLGCFLVADHHKSLNGLSTEIEVLADKVWKYVCAGDGPIAEPRELRQAAPLSEDPAAQPTAIQAASPHPAGNDMGMEGEETGGGIRAVAMAGKAAAGTPKK